LDHASARNAASAQETVPASRASRRAGARSLTRGLGRTAIALAFGLAALALTAAKLDVRASEALRALLGLASLALPAGLLLTRGLAGPLEGPFERLVLAALVGYPVSAVALFLLERAGVAGFLPVVVVLATGIAIMMAVRAARSRWRTWLDTPSLAPMILLTLAVMTLLWGTRALTPAWGGLVYDPRDGGFDRLMHPAFLWELLRGVPPAELPSVAGVPFPSYHVLGYLPGVALVRHAGLGVVTVAHAVLPAAHLSLLLSGILLCVRLRTGSRTLSLAAVVALVFVVNTLPSLAPSFGQALFSLEGAGQSLSGGAGGAVWAAVAALLALHGRLEDDRARQRALLLAALVAGLSYGYKAQTFLIFAPAFVAAVLLSRAGPLRGRLLALAACAGAALALFALSPRITAGSVVFSPGLFGRQAGQAALFPGLGSVEAGLLATPIALLLRLPHALPYLAFGAWRLRRPRSAPLLDLMFALALPFMLLAALTVGMREPEGEISALAVFVALGAVQVAAVPVDVAVLAHVFSRVGLRGQRAVLLPVLSAGVGLLPLTVARTAQRLDGGVVLARGEVDALEYLRRQTPLDAVVATARSRSFPDLRQQMRGLDRFSVVAGLAGRRSVLEYYRPGIDPRHDRHADLGLLFSTRNPVVAEAVLRRYGVDYVLEHPGLRLKTALDGLTVVHESQGVRVWRYGPPPLLPPGRLVASEGLR
jgi:hypothetical protein